jgi:hypothetical protein
MMTPTVEVRVGRRPVGSILAVLEVVTPARRSLLYELGRELIRDRVQIVRVESCIFDDRRLERFSICELDAAPLAEGRLQELERRVRQLAEREVAAGDHRERGAP